MYNALHLPHIFNSMRLLKEIWLMKRLMFDTTKVFIIFVICTFLFYFGLRMIYAEYEQRHRYDLPDGPAVKVFKAEESLIDRLHLFFRLGE